MREINLNAETKEIHIPIIFDSLESAQVEFTKAKQVLESCNAQLLCLEVFSADWVKPAVEKFLNGSQAPVNWILPLDASVSPILASAHITALRGSDVKYTSHNNAKAVLYSDGIIDYCRSFGITSGDANGDGYNAAKCNLQTIKSLLEKCGYKFTDIARTWFYNFELLDWYAEFNKARTEFFEDAGIFKSLLPASTGIGAPNIDNAKMTSGFIAVKDSGGGKSWQISEAESPLQCGAPNYGSSFSRAVEIATPSSRRIFVSGTASIEPMGATVYQGDIEKQVELTMQVIGAILQSRNMSFKDTVKSVVYCASPEYYRTFLKWTDKNGMIPHCPSFSTVCRHDLMFEVELDAAINL